MIAYLIGGPQDIIKLYVENDASRVSFPHREALSCNDWTPNEHPVVDQVEYVKVYTAGWGREPYAIFVHIGSR